MAKLKPKIEDVVDRESIDRWLNALPVLKVKSTSIVLGHRLTLRILHFAAFPENYENGQFAPLLECVMRCHAISRVASTWLTREIALATIPAAQAVTNTTATANTSAVFAAAASASITAYAGDDPHLNVPDYAVGKATNVVYGFYGFYDFAFSSAIGGPHADLWESLRQDMRFIDGGLDNEALLKKPLWTEPPNWWTDAWNKMQRNLLTPENVKDRWDIWASWYWEVSHGQPVFGMVGEKITTLERRIALGDGRKDFWNRDAGEVNREIVGWIEEAREPEEAPVDLSQLPASHTFSLVNGKIVARPVLGAPELADIARDVRQALSDKAREAAKALLESQAPNRFVQSLEKLANYLDNIVNENPALGQLLMLSQTIEIDIATLLSLEFRKRYQEDVLAQCADVLHSLESYRTLFPQLMKIEAQRFALNLVNGDAERVNAQIDIAVTHATQNPIVSSSAITALNEAKPAIVVLNQEILTTNSLALAGEKQEARAKLVGQRAMAFRNFTAETIKVISKNALEGMAEGTKEGTKELTKGAIKAGAILLVHQLAGTWAAISLLVSMFGGLSKRVEDVKKNNPNPDITEV
jgi:hypothetical protein